MKPGIGQDYFTSWRGGLPGVLTSQSAFVVLRLSRTTYLPIGARKIVSMDRLTAACRPRMDTGANAPRGITSVIRPDLKASRSSASGPTEIGCGKPMPGTANCQAFSEWECIDLSPFVRVMHQVCPQSLSASLGQT